MHANQIWASETKPKVSFIVVSCVVLPAFGIGLYTKLPKAFMLAFIS